jgi:hypothetical protein
MDELRHGHRGAAAPDDVADDAVHPRITASLNLDLGVGDVHLGSVLLLERGQLELAGQRGQLRAPPGRQRRRSGSRGCDVGEVAGDVAARRREVHIGRRALADHGCGVGGLLLAV